MFAYSIGEHQQGSAISDLCESRHVIFDICGLINIDFINYCRFLSSIEIIDF